MAYASGPMSDLPCSPIHPMSFQHDETYDLNSCAVSLIHQPVVSNR